MIFLHIGYRVPRFLALLNETTKESGVNMYVLEEVKIILIYLISNSSTKLD
jgi:hypothetical protein